MRAIRVHEVGGPEVLRLEELPVPEPGPGEGLVRLLAIGVNFIDTYKRKGLYHDRKSTRLNSSHMSESRMPSSA